MSNKGPVDPEYLRQIWGLAPPAKNNSLLDMVFPIEAPKPTPPSGPTLADLLGRNPFGGSLPSRPLGVGGHVPSIFQPPAPKPHPPMWGAEYTRSFVRSLLHRRPVFAEGRVLPKLDDLAVMEGRQIEAAFVYTDLASFTKIVATQPVKSSFVLLQAFVELVTRITGHYGGAVVDCAGDRLLSVFHRPAKDYSHKPVYQAITAAFWIQTMLRASEDVFAAQGVTTPMVGIGIDYGSATVGCVGFRNNKRLVFLGKAANNAAKLQDLAGPGETVMSYEAFARRPVYMNNWVVEDGGLHVRVKSYFADSSAPPRPDLSSR